MVSQSFGVAASFDFRGWLAVFVFQIGCELLLVVLYLREIANRRRPYYLFRYRGGVGLGLFFILLTALRLFVVRQ
jgi:hypothetical protein